MAQGRSIGFTFYAKDMFERVAARMADSVQKVKVGLAETATVSRDVTREMERVNASLAKTDATAKKHKDGIKQMDEAWAGLRSRIVAAALAFASVGTFKFMIHEAATVEDAVNKVMSVIRDPGDQKAYAEKVTAIIRENQRLGMSVEGLGDALTEQVGALGTGKDSFDAFAGSVKLSVAAFRPVEESVRAVDKLIEDFPQLRGHGQQAAQLLFSARQMTKDYSGLVGQLPNIGPLAATAGLSPQKMIALFATLEKTTKSSAAAGNISNDILRAIGTQNDPKKTRLLVDMSILTKAGKPNGDLETQLARLRYVSSKNPAAAAAIGLTDPTQRALLNMSDADIKKISAVEKGLQSDAAKGTIEDSYKRVQESTTVELAKTTQALNELASVIGKELTPSVKTIAEKLRDWSLPRVDLDSTLGIKPDASFGEVLEAIYRINHPAAKGASGLDSGAMPGKGG